VLDTAEAESVFRPRREKHSKFCISNPIRSRLEVSHSLSLTLGGAKSVRCLSDNYFAIVSPAAIKRKSRCFSTLVHPLSLHTHKYIYIKIIFCYRAGWKKLCVGVICTKCARVIKGAGFKSECVRCVCLLCFCCFSHFRWHYSHPDTRKWGASEIFTHFTSWQISELRFRFREGIDFSPLLHFQQANSNYLWTEGFCETLLWIHFGTKGKFIAINKLVLIKFVCSILILDFLFFKLHKNLSPRMIVNVKKW